MSDPSGDAALARGIAIEAGRLLVALAAEARLDGAALGAEGDARANVLILAALRAARPEDAILSEEEHDDRARLGARRVWIVDPLDGTREYAERRGDWAVHIGLAIDGVAAAGAVALPAARLCFASDDARAPPARKGALRIAVSRSRAPACASRVAETLGAILVPMGSAGAKAMAVVRGEADAYLHAGGQYEWDSCAPVAVARAAGLHASRLDGAPLLYNRADALVPDLLICRREDAARLIAAAAEPKPARGAPATA